MKRMMLTMMATALLWGVATTARANDGVFFTRGSMLVPIHETDISVKKEVLTITLNDDGYAYVDVDYVFSNTGDEKTVAMGFEATKPYNTGDKINLSGVHPYIKDFTVTMNGEQLSYRNKLVVREEMDKPYTGPTDVEDEDGILPYAYAYLFEAKFKKGDNFVHHTYAYEMSTGVARTFEVPYWLTPATRWKGGSIGDFTLRIRADKTAKHFCLDEELFKGSEFKVVAGTGKVRHSKFSYNTTLIEIAIRNGMVEWHTKNFRPETDMNIISADAHLNFVDNPKFGSFYDRSDSFVIWQMDKKVDKRLARNLPYAHRGYVFKDKKLYDYFSQFFWYMPDPLWQMSTDDFTPRDWKMVNKGE